jgi:hypothetical protein
MSIYRFNRDGRPLVFCAYGDMPTRIPCVFCGCTDLRVCGPRASTFLGCPQCGADGPVGNGLGEAVHKYLNRLNRIASEESESKNENRSEDSS